MFTAGFVGGTMPAAPASTGATVTTATEDPRAAATAIAAHVSAFDAARGPYWCRLTFRSPPRAREWISLRNVPSGPVCSKGPLGELSARLPTKALVRPRCTRLRGGAMACRSNLCEADQCGACRRSPTDSVRELRDVVHPLCRMRPDGSISGSRACHHPDWS